MVEREGHLISIDNRRLQALRDAGVEIPTRMATPEEIAEAIRQNKFTSGPWVPIRFEFEDGDKVVTLLPLEDLPRLHTTPLGEVVVKENQVVVEADDAAERRWRFVFEPYQAVRVTTADCFSTPGRLTLIPQTIVEVGDSEWIVELKAALTRIAPLLSHRDSPDLKEKLGWWVWRFPLGRLEELGEVSSLEEVELEQAQNLAH